MVSGRTPTFNEDWTKPLNESDGILNYLTDNSETERILTSSQAGNYMNYYQELYDHIIFGDQLPSPGFEIIQNMKIIEAALESSREGKVADLKNY